MSLKILQLHKRDSYKFEFIQDRVGYAENQKCFAIADGTTQSFRSEVWAEMVTDTFIKTPVLEPESLIELFSKSAEEFKKLEFKLSSNPAMASLERAKLAYGATATFIGVKVEETNQLSINSLGDSNVFILRNKEVQSFPFTSIDELDKNDYFLNTEKLLSNEVEPSFFQRNTVQLADGDLIILATDALSRLLLKNHAALDKLIQVQNFEEFHEFCLDYWSQRLLEEDDVTALIFHNDTSNSLCNILPPEGFSFLKTEEKEFIPSFQASRASKTNKDEMQHFTNEINRIKMELVQVRKKAKMQSILLFLIMGLVLLNSLGKLISDSSKTQASSFINRLLQLNEVSNNSGLQQEEEVKIAAPYAEEEESSLLVKSKDDTNAEKAKEASDSSEVKVKVTPKVSSIKDKVEQKTENTKK